MDNSDYTSQAFADQVAAKTFCGAHAWHRLMTWLEVDKKFQDFMHDWNTKIAPWYHSNDTTTTNQPNIKELLVVHFEEVYSAQFILRLYQLADDKKKAWLATSLNNEQREVLYYWVTDSQLDMDKGLIVDNWLSSLDGEYLNYKSIPIYTSITSEVFHTISQLSINNTKRLR